MAKPTDVIIVIGFAEALSAPEVAWSLADDGLTVVAFTRKGSRSSLRFSRYVSLFEITAPEVSLANAVVDLKEHVSSLKRGDPHAAIAVMPLDDAAIWLCNRSEHEGGIDVIGPTGNATNLALDKWKQIEHARNAGFFVPSTRYVEKVKDVLGSTVSFPVVLKPAQAVAECEGRLRNGRAWICFDQEELDCAVESWAEREPMLLQQFISGVGEGLFGLATARGVIGWSAHRRLRMMNPEGSGSSACTSADLDDRLKAAGERFIAESGWRGLFMIELLRDDSGKAWFMELNGRSWGSMALARRRGFEYPAWAVRLAYDPEARIGLPQSASRPLVCRHLGRELVHLLYAMRGPKSKGMKCWPSSWKALREILHFSRNDRWYNWRADDRRVFISDLFSTFRTQLFKPKSSK